MLPETEPSLRLQAEPGLASNPAEPLAPAWHSLAISAVLFIAAFVHHGNGSADLAHSHPVLYLGSVVNGWLLLGAVVGGIYHRRRFFFTTLQRAARPWAIELRRAALVFLTYLAVTAVTTSLLHVTPLRHAVNQQALQALAPHSATELILWLAVSATAGFCEEHIFRGYLLPQLIALLLRHRLSARLATIIAILTTSIFFGGLHLYEGVGGAIIIALLGIIYSLYALRFGSLRAVILAHALQDFLFGVLLFFRHGHVV